MSSPLTFGPFQIDLANETLWRGPDRLTLKPKSFAVLRSLVEQPQQLVTKDELLNTHWGDVAVGDAVLKTCIGEIRQALGEHASAPQFIETVHRRGYRFLVTPTPVTTQTGQTAVKSLVGREKELEQLHQWWEEAKTGERQVVFVTGEPGIGKTSLVNAFLDHIATSEEPWVGRGQCIEQYGAGEAYLPILEGLGRLCRQPGGEALVACLHQYAPTWLMHLQGVLEPAEMQQLLPSVMGATPVRMMRELGDAMEEFTRTHPVLFSLEDLHWLDASSLELLSYVARRSHPAQLMVLGTYRPADLILLDHPLKQTKQELLVHNLCQELHMECLTEPAVEAYLKNRLLKKDQEGLSLHTLSHSVHQRTEGNPLFMVNVTNYLMNHNLLVVENKEWKLRDNPAATTIPTGLRQFIDLRVEQLDLQDRQILTIASIAGMEFNTATIAACLDVDIQNIDQRLHDLVHHEQFIRTIETTRWPDGTPSAQHEFLHALYQEALYDHVPETQRIELHQKIGARLEQGYGEHAKTISPELALHFERGHDPDRASLYHQQAGEDAFKRSAHQEAILHLTKALELFRLLPLDQQHPERELTLQSTLGIQYMYDKSYAAIETGEAFGRARELCQRLPNNPHLVPVLYGLLRYYFTKGETKIGCDLARELTDIVQSSSDPVVHLISHTAMGGTALYCGDLDMAAAHLGRTLSCNLQEDSITHILRYGEDTRFVTQSFYCWLLTTIGFPDQAAELGKELLSRARAVGSPYVLAGSLMSFAVCHRMRRDDNHIVIQLLNEGIEISKKHGFSLWMSEYKTSHESAKILLGQFDESWTKIMRGLKLQRLTGYKTNQPFNMAFCAEAALRIGYFQEGLELMEEGIALINETGLRWYEAELTRLKGELILGLGEPDKEQAIGEAEVCFQEAIKFSRKQGAKLFELRAIISLSRLWQQQGKGKQARPKLKKTYDWFTEGFATKDLQEAKTLLGQLG